MNWKSFFLPSQLLWKIFGIIFSLFVLLFGIGIAIGNESRFVMYLVYPPLILANLSYLPVFEQCDVGFICIPSPSIFGWFVVVLSYLLLSYIIAFFVSKIILSSRK
ncbi:hypothetical protein HZA38_00980 [Candidatus Peregrinibacteria bacterium]|nr:hypothetical protein [Candidatus Peregrinibacteria bacterium]